MLVIAAANNNIIILHVALGENNKSPIFMAVLAYFTILNNTQ